VRPHRYRISIAGHLGPATREAFGGMEIVCAEGRTDVVGEVDQAALFGMLARVRALALELVEVQRLEPLSTPNLPTGIGMTEEFWTAGADRI
jgi:hypothetical protein